MDRPERQTDGQNSQSVSQIQHGQQRIFSFYCCYLSTSQPPPPPPLPSYLPNSTTLTQLPRSARGRTRAVFNKPAGYSNTSMNTRLTELSPPVIGSKTSLSLPFRYCALITCHALAPCNTNGSPHSACNRRSSPVSRSKTSMSKKTHHLCLELAKAHAPWFMSMCQIAF